MSQKPHQRRGLGRGLGALIPTGPRPDEDSQDGHGQDGHGQDESKGAVLTVTSPDWIGAPLPVDGLIGAVPAGDGMTEQAVERADGSGGDGSGGDGSRGDGSGGEVEAGTSTDAAAGSESGSSSGSRPGEGAAMDVELRSVAGAWFAELPIDEIRANRRQPREVFDEEAMAELVASIREVGLLQPVVVRPVQDGYELVMGERRWRATREAGLTSIPAIVRATSDHDLLRDALLENLHRAELNALEEAAAYQQLLEDFGCTHDELASRIGRSRPQISNTIRLLKLSPAVQRRVAAGVLSAGHARTLLAVVDAASQDRLAARVVAEGISVRGLEELVTTGDVGGRSRTPRRARPTAPGVEDLAARLSDRLETRVKVDLGRRKGRITVEFASVTDLERIVAVIDPGHPTRTPRPE